MLIVALDPPFGPSGEYRVLKIVEDTCDIVSGYKVGLPLLLVEGPSIVRAVKKKCEEKKLVADLKLADIGAVMSFVARVLRELGADAIIAHSFTGVKGALDELVQAARSSGLDTILVASMSHEGSAEFVDKHFEEFVSVALQLGVHGVVVGATKPWLIKRARELSGERLAIYSPGIGAQGAKPGDALCAGANYEIVGRLITKASEPRTAAYSVVQAQLSRVGECRG